MPHIVEEYGYLLSASSYAETFDVQAMAQMELGLITGLTLSEKRIFMETRSSYNFDKIDQMHKVWPAIKLIADSHVTTLHLGHSEAHATYMAASTSVCTHAATEQNVLLHVSDFQPQNFTQAGDLCTIGQA